MSGASALGSSADVRVLGVHGADLCLVAAAVKESADKPGIGDFSLGASLGEGNFSRIVRATHRATGEAFALKTIEKTRVKRLRIRHPNIFNEINMEKDVLNQLRHPNIIRLYHTFQVRGAGCRHAMPQVRLTHS
jgi:serine/threonine protein kinase